jgi:hypothetical protein
MDCLVGGDNAPKGSAVFIQAARWNLALQARQLTPMIARVRAAKTVGRDYHRFAALVVKPLNDVGML